MRKTLLGIGDQLSGYNQPPELLQNLRAKINAEWKKVLEVWKSIVGLGNHEVTKSLQNNVAVTEQHESCSSQFGTDPLNIFCTIQHVIELLVSRFDFYLFALLYVYMESIWLFP